MFKDREPRRTIEKVNGRNKLTNLEDINLVISVIHIHGRMEHNLAEYAEYYSCGNTKISGGSEFTRKTNYSIRDFSRHW
jgi:hypothetical protein